MRSVAGVTLREMNLPWAMGDVGTFDTIGTMTLSPNSVGCESTPNQLAEETGLILRTWVAEMSACSKVISSVTSPSGGVVQIKVFTVFAEATTHLLMKCHATSQVPKIVLE